MNATVIPTRRTLWFRLQRLAVLAWCWFESWDLDTWIAACEADGIYDTEHLSECRKRLEQLRVTATAWRNA